MKWKEFFKPDWKRILIFAIIFSFVFGKIFVYEDMIDRRSYPSEGYPLPFFKITTLGNPGQPFMLASELNFFNIMIDLIIWYLISCLIVSIYMKIRKKETKK